MRLHVFFFLLTGIMFSGLLFSDEIQEPPAEVPHVDPVKKAEQFFKEHNYFMAEATLMGSEETEDLELKAILLVHTAQKLGNMAGKSDYYEGFLDQGSSQRKLALLFRAWYFAWQHDWNSFQSQAASALLEVESFPHHTDLVLLYCLARYTSQSSETLDLDPPRKAWFQALRDTSSNQRFPVSFFNESLPSFLMRIPYLGTASKSPSGGLSSPCDSVMDSLFTIDGYLQEGNLFAVAEEFNKMDTSTLQPFPWDFRIDYYRLLARFFEMNEEPERQQKVLRKMIRIKKEFQINFECFQDKVLPKLIVEPHRTEVIVPGKLATLEQLEQALPLLDRDSFMKSLNDLSSESLYQQIYKNLIVGKYYLIKGRYQTAYAALSDAETGIAGKPFPVLESKVLTTMGDYYLKEHNLEQANWYWLAASQALCESEALPLLSNPEVYSAPFDRMIDAFLLKPVENQLSAVLYAHQMRELLRHRVLSYQKGQMSENRVIGNQLLEIGEQVSSEIEKLRRKTGSLRLSNLSDLRELWGQLWPKTRSDLRDFAPLNLREMKQNLSKREVLLVFTEGREQLGAAVVATDRAFISYLGPKSSFSSQLSTLVKQQLGKAVDFSQNHGILSLSPVFTSSEFLDYLTESNPGSSFQILLQLAGMTPLWNTELVSNLVVFYDSSVTIKGNEQAPGFSMLHVDSSTSTFLNRESLDSRMAVNSFFIFEGSLKMDGGEIILGTEPVKVPLARVLDEQELAGFGFGVKNFNQVQTMFDELCFLGNHYRIPVIIAKGSPHRLVLPTKVRANSLMLFQGN